MTVSKPAKSYLIESFMDLADKGVIRAEKGNLEADGILFKMYLALYNILDGEKPDAALAIVRTKGVRKKPNSLSLALFVHYYKYEMKEKWITVEKLAEAWLHERGQPVVKEAGLKKIYKRYRTEVEEAFRRRDSVIEHYRAKRAKEDRSKKSSTADTDFR